MAHGNVRHALVHARSEKFELAIVVRLGPIGRGMYLNSDVEVDVREEVGLIWREDAAQSWTSTQTSKGLSEGGSGHGSSTNEKQTGPHSHGAGGSFE
jgi:hypothetical protein